MDIQDKNLNTDKIQPKIAITVKEQWRKFSQETTLHGLQNINQNCNYGVKCIWLIVVLGMAVGYIITVSDSAKAYLRYETRTTSQKVWNKSLDFPTVTFCSLNYISKTVAQKKYPILLTLFLPQLKNDTNNELTETVSSSTSIYNNSEYVTRSTPIYDNPEYKISLYDMMKEGFIPIEDTFYDCKWSSSKVNCSDYIGITLTDTSICYYFPSEEIRKKSPDDFLVVQAGPQLGLSVTVDIHEEEYLLTMQTNTYSYGMKAIIHDPTKSPVPDLEGIDLSPGMQHNIGITREETTRLTTPYGKSECISREEYSYESCLAKCLNYIRFSKCDCNPISNGTDACVLYDLLTCADYEAEAYFSGKCMCKPPCNEVLYHAKMSSLAFPSDIGYQRMKYVDNINKTKDYVKKNIMNINIFYNYMEYMLTEQKPAITSNQFIGDIGGQLGLFLGASFITIAEFIEFFIKLCHNYVNKKKQ